METTKKVTITLTPDAIGQAKSLSVHTLGRENMSGYVAYLIKKAHLEMLKNEV